MTVLRTYPEGDRRMTQLSFWMKTPEEEIPPPAPIDEPAEDEADEEEEPEK
jgi:hypothetical protein